MAVKKGVSYLLALVMLLCAGAIPNGGIPALRSAAAEIAESGSCGDNATYTLDSDGLLTVTGTGRLYPGAFQNNQNIVTAVIGEGITDSSYKTFYNCNWLTSVKLPHSLKSIGASAFESSGLTDVYYYGTPEEWALIDVLSDNNTLSNANIHTMNCITVQYNANGGGGAPEAQSKTEGVALQLSNTIPTKTFTVTLDPCGGRADMTEKTLNARFMEWNTAQDGTGDAYAPGGSYTKDADVTLYAQWQNPTVGALPVPEKAGFTFDGWFTAASGGERVAETAVINASVALYAHWIAALMGDVNGSDSVTAADARLVLRAAVGLESFTAYQKALADLNGDGKVTAADARLALRAAVGLDPQWRIGDPIPVRNYTVRFNANGGTGAPETQTKTEGRALTLSTQTPKKAYTLTMNANGGSVSQQRKTVNCDFIGWNTQADGTGTDYNPGGVYNEDDDVTLHAQWSVPKAGSLPTPTRSGYTFIGWFTAVSGGTQIDKDTSILKNTVLYARWQQNATENIFTKIPVEFGFYPGAGGFQLGIEVHEDGTIRGWSTSRAIESGSGYDVTFYVTEYTAKLTDVKKIDEYTYSMKLTNLQAKPSGTTTISDRARTITEAPSYVENGDVFMLYLPGTTSEVLPEYLINLTSWVLSYDSSKPIHFYVLYNQTKDKPYWSTEK